MALSQRQGTRRKVIEACVVLLTRLIQQLHAHPLLSEYTRFSVFCSSTKLCYINTSHFQVFRILLLLMRAMLHFEESIGFILYRSFV